MSDASITAARNRLREQQRDLARYDTLEKVLKYLREYGGDLTVNVKFAAGQCNGHDESAQFVKEHYFADWGESGRRKTQMAVEAEMAEIKERLS